MEDSKVLLLGKPKVESVLDTTFEDVHHLFILKADDSVK